MDKQTLMVYRALAVCNQPSAFDCTEHCPFYKAADCPVAESRGVPSLQDAAKEIVSLVAGAEGRTE